MERLDFASLGALSAAALRGLIVRLAGELNALRVTVTGLEGRIGALQDENTALREQAAALAVENRTLKDEVARLKELPRRPPDKPSGMEQSTETGQASNKKARSRRRRGATMTLETPQLLDWRDRMTTRPAVRKVAGEMTAFLVSIGYPIPDFLQRLR